MLLYLVLLVFWVACSIWFTLFPLPITQDDVAVWPYSVDILLVFSSFLASLHWPQGSSDLGKFGTSYFELLLMFEIFAGHRLLTEKTVRPHLRARRSLVFSGFPVGIGHLRSFFRALGHLPGSLARIIPCQPSAHHARLLHLGWERDGHGLTSRPRESCDHWFLTPLLNFFGYPSGAVTELFSGCLKLRYSSTPFSKKMPSWSVSTHPVVPVGVPGSGSRVHFPDHDPVVQRPAKRFRITGKSSAQKREPISGDGLPTPKRWKRLVPPGTGLLRIEDGVPPFLFPRTGVG